MAWRCKEHQFAERILNSLPMLIARIEPLSGYQLPPTTCRLDGNAISWMFSMHRLDPGDLRMSPAQQHAAAEVPTS